MKKIGLIIVLLAGICVVKAQERMSVENIVLPILIIDSSKINPYLNFCGVVRDMELNCLDSNQFARTKDNVWRKQIKIQSESAKEIKIVFQKFILSSNAVISFYTNDTLQYQYQGTFFIHKPDSSYISNFVYGDNCTIVIEIPINELNENQIIISKIYHFNETFNETVRALDYSCMIDVNCSEGDNWCDQKRSVALCFFPIDGMLSQCTGVLVNNYQNNFTQYFLTATHCLEGVDLSTAEFYFKHQNSFCNSGDAGNTSYHNYYRVLGSQLVGFCDISWSDNALLLITEPIPIQYNVYYAGVDITDRSIGDGVTCIHHSEFYPKKIVSGKLKNFAGAKWEMRWDNGVIAHGGSGAPIFLNSNKRVIANVTNALKNKDCSNDYNPNWVGKVKACMSYSGNMQSALFGNSVYSSYSGIDPIKACQSTLNLQGDFYPTKDHDATLNGLTIQAGNTITVSSAIFRDGSNYTLTAGDRIVLQPGTRIEAGATVSMKIAPCSGSLTSCGMHSDNHKSADIYSKEYDEENDIIMGENKLTLSPNPNSGKFTINTNIDPQEVLSVQVFSMLGQSIYQQAGLPNNVIQLPSSASGVFYVEVITTGERFIRKMVVQ